MERQRFCGRHPLDSYVELHIEQGPVLEAEKKTIGIVEGAQGIRWYDIALEGAVAHAGTTPMVMRRDASLAAARIISAANALCEEIGPGAFATTGVLEAHPNSRNVVPSRVFLTVDLRHTQTPSADCS